MKARKRAGSGVALAAEAVTPPTAPSPPPVPKTWTTELMEWAGVFHRVARDHWPLVVWASVLLLLVLFQFVLLWRTSSAVSHVHAFKQQHLSTIEEAILLERASASLSPAEELKAAQDALQLLAKKIGLLAGQMP